MENYRPISLLSVVGKVLERCILNRLLSDIKSRLDPAQHGFVSGKSCTTQLLSVLNTIGKNLDMGKETDVIFMDMAKAFDRVDHPTLLHRLSKFGISDNLLDWFCDYLTHRSQQVTVHGSTSSQLPITSGVPQGSLLGPFLFLVYVNDIPTSVSNSTGVGLFADDTKLFRCIQSSEDVESLQSDVDCLNGWSMDSHMPFNITKCKVLRVSRKNTQFPLLIPLITMSWIMFWCSQTWVLRLTVNYYGQIKWNQRAPKLIRC